MPVAGQQAKVTQFRFLPWTATLPQLHSRPSIQAFKNGANVYTDVQGEVGLLETQTPLLSAGFRRLCYHDAEEAKGEEALRSTPLRAAYGHFSTTRGDGVAKNRLFSSTHQGFGHSYEHVCMYPWARLVFIQLTPTRPRKAHHDVGLHWRRFSNSSGVNAACSGRLEGGGPTLRLALALALAHVDAVLGDLYQHPFQVSCDLDLAP